jgi:hypothetical protein
VPLILNQMGQISEDMLNGTCCQFCGQYFHNPNSKEENTLYVHDYPVVCWDCWKEMPKRERKDFYRAKVPTI